MEIAGGVCGGATPSVIAHVDREVGYFVHFKRNRKTHDHKARELAVKRGAIQKLIDDSLNNNEDIKESVTDWLKKVDIVVEDARKLSDKATKINRWYKGWFCSRFKLGRKAFKKIDVIQKLLVQSSGFVSVGDPKPLGIVSYGDFEAFASREDTRKKVVKALQNNQVSMIGVFGMPGVGKTMLMKEITEKAQDNKLFDKVVLVTVSQKPDIGKIQAYIAQQLGLTLRGSSIEAAARELLARLSQGKKVLVAFDDIWKRLEIKEVGIPYKSQGCKVLFTTRSEDVCDRMEVHKKIEVRVLSEEDSWILFRQKAGDVVDSSSHQEVARDVFNECKGLPLAIVTLGLALRNKDKIVWLDASTRLKKSIYEGEGMDHLISIVKLSYEFLYDDKARMCFLFCSLFPEDFRIKFDVLLSYMLGEELLIKGDNMEEARNKLHTIIDKLTSSGILLRSEGGDIMMHDIIRDVAINIASDPDEGKGFIVKSGLGLKEWPQIDREMEKCRRLSLMRNDLRFCPPHQITASVLLTLSLFQNQNLEEIPSDFFKEMKHLKTLDLSKTGIRSLPPSFPCLESLHTLYMEECDNLMDISLVAELQTLVILSIRASTHVEIPVNMQKLTNLKMLKASGVRSLFPPKVISSMHRLEELYLYDHDIETEVVFSEVASLTRLTRLKIRLPVECMLKDFPSHWKNLSKFSIDIGGKGLVLNVDELSTRRVSLNLGSSTQNLPPSIRISNWVGVLSEKIERLVLQECHHLLIVADLNGNGLYSSLRTLHVIMCSQVRHLLSTTSLTRLKLLFSNLEVLCLSELEKFVAICDGPIPAGFLSKLKKLIVKECPTVSTLIPFDLLGNLQKLEEFYVSSCDGLEKVVQSGGSMSKQPPSMIFPCLRRIHIWGCDKLKCVVPMKAARHLEELSISYCSDMEMVFEGDDGDDANEDDPTLPHLKTLSLWGLPSLSCFGPPGLLFDFLALIDMTVTGCGNLKRLPLLGKQSIPKLKKLEVDSGWLDGLEYEDESLKVHLKSLPGLV